MKTKCAKTLSKHFQHIYAHLNILYAKYDSENVKHKDNAYKKKMSQICISLAHLLATWASFLSSPFHMSCHLGLK